MYVPDAVLSTGDAKINNRGLSHLHFSRKSNCKITRQSQQLISIQINRSMDLGPAVLAAYEGGVEFTQLTEGKTLASRLVLVLPQLCRCRTGTHGKKM